MAVLDNPKHEAFAQAIAAGETAEAAYAASGLVRKTYGAQGGFYVYALIDPFRGRVFYIGKGSGNRAAHHAKAWRRDGERNKIKTAKIGEIEARGGRVVIHVLEDGLSHEEALRLERMIIVRAHAELTNISMGEKTAAERIRADARRGLSQIKPLCVLLREQPDPSRIKVWLEVTTHLASIARMGAA